MQYALHNGQVDFTPDQHGVWAITYTDSDGNTATKTINVLEGAVIPTPPAPVSPEPEPIVKSQQDQFPWIIVIVVLIAAVLLLFFFMRRRSQRSNPRAAMLS
jgi:uncharacterized protein YpmB